jgi:hypothetical protein
VLLFVNLKTTFKDHRAILKISINKNPSPASEGFLLQLAEVLLLARRRGANIGRRVKLLKVFDEAGNQVSG